MDSTEDCDAHDKRIHDEQEARIVAVLMRCHMDDDKIREVIMIRRLKEELSDDELVAPIPLLYSGEKSNG